MKTISLVAISIILIATVQSCKKDELGSNDLSSSSSSPSLKSFGNTVFYGPTVPIGNGVARAWVKENANGDPVSVGINLSEKALQSLPSEPEQFVLYFPKNKGKQFYKHMLVDWNPNGHEPPGIYGLPHFDFHFYTITNQERLAIGPPGAPEFDILPPAQYVPFMYMDTPGGVPQMGAHWVDLLAPEFNGGVFSKTFIYGSWNGSFIFYEPMITVSYLLSHPDAYSTVRQPSAYQQDGWYPTGYKVTYSDSPGEYTIALTDLAYAEGQ